MRRVIGGAMSDATRSGTGETGSAAVDGWRQITVAVWSEESRWTMPMAKPLRVLFIDESDAAARTSLEELRRGGFEPVWERVDSEPAFHAALQQRWELIIADHTASGFSAVGALRVLEAEHADIPFIVVSRAVGEEVLIAAMKAGVHDYVSTRYLARLVPAVERELREAAERCARRHAEEALRAGEQRYRDIVETSHDWMWTADLDGVLTFSNQALAHVLGYAPDSSLGRPLFEFLAPSHATAFRAFLKSVHNSAAQLETEAVMLSKDRKPLRLSIRATALRDGCGRAI